MFRFLKADIEGCVHGSAGEPGEIARQPLLLRKAFKLGERLSR